MSASDTTLALYLVALMAALLTAVWFRAQRRSSALISIERLHGRLWQDVRDAVHDAR